MSIHQLVKQHVNSIGSLILESSTKVKLLSKALVARLIPTGMAENEMAVLMLIEDNEVDLLINMLSISPISNQFFPIVSIISDLCRSPHNMYAMASKDIASKLSDTMESFSEEDQSRAAQLIWEVMQLNYEGDEEVTAVVSNGTLQPSLDQGIYNCSYGINTCSFLLTVGGGV